MQRQEINKELTLDVQTHYKENETLQYTNFYLNRPPSLKKGLVSGEALPFLRTFLTLHVLKNVQIFKICCKNRGYPDEILEKYLSEVNFTGRERSLKNKENITQRKCCLSQHNNI